MTSGVYAIINKKKNKIYIGQSRNIEKRWKDHRNCLDIDVDIKNDGEENFDFIIIEKVKDKKLLHKREQYWIEHYNAEKNNNYYNKPRQHSDETKQKMKEAKLGISRPNETKIKMSKARNNTGYFRVSKVKTNSYTQGYCFQYGYYDSNIKRQKMIRSKDIKTLKKKVEDRGLEWRKF